MSTSRYPLWLRAWHWLHGLCFVAEVLTGLALHYADVSAAILPFRVAVVAHNVLGVALVVFWIAFLIGNAAYGHQKHYWPRLKGIFHQGRKLMAYYSVGILRGEPSPFAADANARFNPIQQLTYFLVMYGLMPAIAFSGILLLFPEWAPEEALGAGAVWPMAVLHLVAGYLLTLFLAVHVYLGTTGATPLALFRAMWRGEDGDGVLSKGDAIAYDPEGNETP
jgi:thiosulfate reductase cytochrome b subunit